MADDLPPYGKLLDALQEGGYVTRQIWYTYFWLVPIGVGSAVGWALGSVRSGFYVGAVVGLTFGVFVMLSSIIWRWQKRTFY